MRLVLSTRALPAVAVAALALAIACGGDGSSPTPTAGVQAPTRTPTREATQAPTPTPTPEPAETLGFIRDGDIWLVNVDGSNERRLNLRNVQSFSWVSSEELDAVIGGDPPAHMLVDVEGNARELPFPAGGSWSRDGRLYVVPVDQQLVVFERDGGEIVRLEVMPPIKDDPGIAGCQIPKEPNGESYHLIFGQPAFSPDAQRIFVAVYCAPVRGATFDPGVLPRNLNTQLYKLSLDGAVNRPLQELVTNLRVITSPRFSPDGSRVAQAAQDYVNACATEYSLAVADADGANGRPLTLAAIDELHQRTPYPVIRGGLVGYDWSPDGNAVAGSFNVSTCDEFDLQPFLTGLYLMELDVAAEEKLVDGPTRSPAWSPSGDFIAYVAGEYFGELTDPPIIRLLDLTTREVIDLAQGAAPAWQPQP